MKPITAVLLGGLLLSGCVHRHVTVVDRSPAAEVEVYGDPGEEVYLAEEACEPVWDGHTFLVIESHSHGSGCGHYFHHSSWHLYPHDWVYAEIGYSHCGDTGGFYHDGNPWARAWDGLAFIMLHGHVHGAGCGHHYHHGCWNTHRGDYVHVDRRRGHFSPSPSRHHGDRHESAARAESRKLRSVVAPSPSASPAVRGRREALAAPAAAEAQGRREAKGRRVEPERMEAPRPVEQPRRVEAAGRQNPRRVEAPKREEPQRREQPQRIEQPKRQEAPQRIEQPKKREAPQRIEQPRKQEQPKRIEQPKRQEAPQRIEQPKKQEQPKRIEPPQRKEAPKKQDPPQRREAPKEKRR